MEEISFEGNYFDGKTSKANRVGATFDGSLLHVFGDGVLRRYSLKQTNLQPRMGTVRRVFEFSDGSRLESDSGANIAVLEDALGLNKGMRLVDRFERSWKWVVTSIGVMVLAGAAFYLWGLPWLAQKAAFATPSSVTQPITDKAMEILDGQYMLPSKLSKQKQAHYRKIFQKVTKEIGGNYDYKLEFRKGNVLGANAFALPSGTSVFTDEIIALAKNDREIEGIMAHEVGHVIHQHSMRQIYQGLGVVMMISIIAGDVTSATSIGASVPAAIVNNGYSRKFEAQSDETAGNYLMKHYGTTKALGDALKHLTDSHPGSSGIPDMLSTHPGTANRITHLKTIESNYKK